MRGASAVLPADAPPRRVPPKRDRQAPLRAPEARQPASQSEATKNGESSRSGGSNIRPRSRAPRYDSHQRPPDPGLAIAHTVDPQPPIGKARRHPDENEATIWSMALAETQQLRMLERLRRAGKQPVPLGELRSGGIDFPAVVLSELELNGYPIERLYEHDRLIGVRLLETETPDTPPSRRRHRSRRPSR